MSEDVVRALFAAFDARDEAAGIAVLDPEAELFAQPTSEVTGRTEPYRGHGGWREYLRDVEAAWERFGVEPADFRSVAGGVIAFGAAEGVPRGSGEARRVPVIWVFRLREGRIRSVRVARTAAEATSMLDA